MRLVLIQNIGWCGAEKTEQVFDALPTLYVLVNKTS